MLTLYGDIALVNSSIYSVIVWYFFCVTQPGNGGYAGTMVALQSTVNALPGAALLL